MTAKKAILIFALLLSGNLDGIKAEFPDKEVGETVEDAWACLNSFVILHERIGV